MRQHTPRQEEDTDEHTSVNPVASGGVPILAALVAAAGVVVALLAACGGDPPTACESIPQQTLFVRETSLIQPCFTDPEGEKLTLSAKAADKQIATVIVLGGAIRIQALYPGNTTVTVTAEDPGGQTASIDIDVLVPNRPPTTRGRLSSIRMLVEASTRG